jgi:GNAT superfamily N-acetyltransferase
VQAYVEPLWGWNEPQQDTLALEFLKNHNAIHEIALVTDTPIGYLSYQNKAEVLLLNKLYLHPDHHGRGHGRRIMLRIIRLAYSGRKPIELSVLTTNPRARKFYEPWGFIAVTETAQKVHMTRSCY